MVIHSSVALQAFTQPVDTAMSMEEFIAYCARVSNPKNQQNHLTAKKLLRFLARERHWSPFEMANLVIEIKTTRDIARQILRHRSFTFQEFCVAGDTLITLELPSSDKGKRAAYQRTIEHLYKLQSTNQLPKYVRVYDEDKKEFVRVGIKEVFNTGIKPVYKITLANGKTITTTKEHKFLTPEGFAALEDAVGLQHIGNTVVMTKHNAFACNGIPLYQNAEWMAHAKEKSIRNKTGLQGIASEAGVSYHTVRKWLRIHNLQFTKKEVANYTEIWNKNKHGYQLRPHTLSTIEKMRKSARRGAESNLWKGGSSRSERLKIADWCNSMRTEFLKKFNYACRQCGSHQNLQLHHIVPVFENPNLAYDKNNIEVLCKHCHHIHHSINGNHKTWRQKAKGNRLTIDWSMVKSIEFVGEVQTYDLEVEHHSHNYVANGIVTHNSQRYAEVGSDTHEIREARLQDTQNRQSSIEIDDPDLQDKWNLQQALVNKQAHQAYRWALEQGIAKEVARAVLPEGLTMSRMYVNGTVRSWLHYCSGRTGFDTQKEHRLLAHQCWKIVCDKVPSLAEIEL